MNGMQNLEQCDQKRNICLYVDHHSYEAALRPPVTAPLPARSTISDEDVRCGIDGITMQTNAGDHRRECSFSAGLNRGTDEPRIRAGRKRAREERKPWALAQDG